MSRLNETEATVEQRARAVRYWEQEIRPRIAPKEQAEPKEDPFAALVRLKSEGWAIWRPATLSRRPYGTRTRVRPHEV